MKGELQILFDAIVDGLAGVAFHLVTLIGPAVGCEDEGEEGDQSDKFHDDIQI